MFFWHLKTAFTQSRKNKLRFIIAILVVGLSISLIVAVNGLVDSIAYNYSGTVFTELSDSDIVVKKEENGIIYNISSLSDSFNNVNLNGISSRYSVDGNLLFTSENNQNTSFPTQIIGINFSQENMIKLGEFTPNYENLGLNKSIMFGNYGKQVTSNIGYNITTELTFSNRKAIELSLEIVEVVEQYKKFSRNSWNVIIVSLETLYQFVEEDSATTIVGVFEDHETLYSINDIDGSLKKVKERAITIQKNLGFDYSVNLPLAESFESAQDSLDGQRLILNFIGIVVLIVTGVLIYGLNNTAIEEKSYDFGVYRAFGLKNYHIIIQSFLQAIIKGIFGIILGIIFGYVLVSYLFSTGDLTVPISIGTYIYAIIMGSLLIFFSSLYPVLQSTKKEILISLDLTKVESSSFQSRITTIREGWIVWSKIIYGVALSSLSIVLFLIFPYLQFFHGQQVVNSFGLGLLLLSLLGFIFIILGLFSPIFTQTMLFLFSIVFRKSSLGVKIFLRKNAKRNNITSIIFALSLAFVFFMSTLQSTSFQGQIANLQSNLGSNLVILPIDPTKEDLSTEVLNFTDNKLGIFTSFVTTGNIFTITGSFITVGDDLLFKSFNPQVHATKSNLLNALFPDSELVINSNFTAIDDNNTVVISNSIAKSLNLGIGDDIRVKISSPIDENELKYGKNIYLKIVGILNRLPGFPSVTQVEDSAESSPIFIGLNTWYTLIAPNNNSDTLLEISHEKYIQQIFIRGEKNDINELKRELFIEFGTEILILDYDDLFIELNQRLEASLNGITMILSLSIIIALFAVISSTSTSVTEAKNDIGILKSIGLRDNMIAKIFILESVIVSITATILGGIAGYITAYLPTYNNSLYSNYPIIIVTPPDAIIFTYIFAVLLAIIGAYIPSKNISKMQVMDIFRK